MNGSLYAQSIGFGMDIGGEKFMDIKCRSSGLRPDCAVLVATIRALKMHGGGPPVAGGNLPAAYRQPNVDLVRAGCNTNLRRQIEAARRFNVPVVVCINRFASDSAEELRVVETAAREFGAIAGVVSEHWAQGGAGAVDLARAVINACDQSSSKFE